MKYSRTALILYALTLFIFILVGALGGLFKSSPAPYEGFEEAIFLVVVEPILLIIAIIFSVLACIKEKGTLAKIPIAIPIAILILIVLFTIMSNIFNTIHHKKEFTNNTLYGISNKINEHLPKMINEKLRLDETFAYGNNINFAYTMLDSDSVDIDEFWEMIRKDSDSNQDVFYENKVNIYYIIKNKEGNRIAAFTYDSK